MCYDDGSPLGSPAPLASPVPRASPVSLALPRLDGIENTRVFFNVSTLCFSREPCSPHVPVNASDTSAALLESRVSPSSSPSPLSLTPVDAAPDPRRTAALSLPPKQTRKPRAGNELAYSVYRPIVPADRRVLLWSSPFAFEVHQRLAQAGIQVDLQARIYEGLLRATTDKSRESYGAGLLRFHQFCDRGNIPERDRMPADRLLLAAFVADAIGTLSGKGIRNWLNGLRLWHLFNDAPWYGDDGWLPSLKKAADRAGVPFKRPPRGPITKAHLRAIRASLDLTSGFGAATWSTATACFWGCRRLGELVISSPSKFSLEHDTTRDTRTSFSCVNAHDVVSFHIVWTKTTTILGADCVLTATMGDDTDLCPVWAFRNHLAVNHSPPASTPLFAYRERDSWRVLTKNLFLRTTCATFGAAGLENVFGHSYRIGGSVELLLAGVEPEVIMKLGGWTSLCFLIYWRRLEQILPQRITAAWAARIQAFASTHNHSYDTSALNFDED